MEFLDIYGRFYLWLVMPFILILVHSPCRRHWSMYDLTLPCTFLVTLLWWKSVLDGGYRECILCSTSITHRFWSTIVVEPQQKYHYPSIFTNSEYEQELTILIRDNWVIFEFYGKFFVWRRVEKKWKCFGENGISIVRNKNAHSHTHITLHKYVSCISEMLSKTKNSLSGTR